MAVGEFILFFCGSIYATHPDIYLFFFFLGLGFMIAGNGFFKPNISSMVGQLYPKGDLRIDPAYTIFYMGINLGGALGPIVCALVGNTGNPADFKWAFLAGGIAMLISVVVQKVYQDKYLLAPDGSELGNTPVKAAIQTTSKGGLVSMQPGKRSLMLTPLAIIVAPLIIAALAIGALYLDLYSLKGFLGYLLLAAVIFIAFVIYSDKSLDRIAKQKVSVIFIVSFFVVFFWAAFEQAGASLTFFANEQTNRDLGWFVIPPAFFSSLNSIFIVIFAPIFAWIWLRMGKRQPSAPAKMALGLLFLALGYLWIAYGVKGIGPGIKVSMIWLTGMYAFHTWGELCLSPIGMSLVNKLSPLKFASLLMAVWFLANAAANKLAGVLSALYPDNGVTTQILGYHMNNLYDFFLMFVVMAGVAALILFLLVKKLQQMMHGIK